MLRSREVQGWKLTATLSEESDEIRIIGDRAGLEHLAACCLSIIGKEDAGGHIHLDPVMYNLSEGSVPILLQYDADRGGKIPRAATGKRRAK